jgi:cell division protein FtsA
MPGALELAEKVLEMPVRIGVPRDIGGLNDTVQSPIYATGVGLVMYAAKHHADLREQDKSVTLKQGLRDIIKRIWR